MLKTTKGKTRTIKLVVEAKVAETYPGSRSKKQLIYDRKILKMT